MKQSDIDYDFISDEVKGVCSKFNLEFVDPKHKTTHAVPIIAEIETDLRNSKIVIADISEVDNANVYYEIGFVDGAYSNKLILIGEKTVIDDRKVPFDLSGRRIVKYGTAAPEHKKFLTELEKVIQKLIEVNEE